MFSPVPPVEALACSLAKGEGIRFFKINPKRTPWGTSDSKPQPFLVCRYCTSKPREKWTDTEHERFVNAVNQ